MSRSQRMARRLVETQLPNAEVSSILFRTAGSFPATTMPTPVPAAQALSSAKKDGWEVAVTHANSATDPMVLERLAKDSRKQVRRAVACNPHTNDATRQYLLTWAYGKAADTDIIRVLANSINLEWLLTQDTVDLITESRLGFDWRVAARRIVDADDPKLLERALALHFMPLDMTLACELVNRPVAYFSMTDLINSYQDPADATKVYCGAWSSAREVTYELTTLAMTTLSESYMSRISGVTSFTPEAIELTLSSDQPTLWAILASCTKDPVVLDRLLDKKARGVAKNLVPGRLNVLSQEQIDRVLGQLRELNVDYDANSALAKLVSDKDEKPAYEVSSSAMIELLRHARLDSTQNWLEGRLWHKPAPGDVTALLAGPGRSLNDRYGHTVSYGLNETPSQRQMALALDRAMEQALDKPWTDELVDALGPGFFDASNFGPKRSAYVVRRLTNGIGITPKAWEMAWGLLDNFEGSLGDLITMTRRLLKVAGEEIVLPDPEPNVQLSLLS